MDFLKRIFRRRVGATRGATETDPQGPGESSAGTSWSTELIGDPESDSPFVSVPMGHCNMIMDRMAYEHMRGLTPGTLPAQADLDDVIRRVDRVRVFAGGMYRDQAFGVKVLIDSSDPGDVGSLRDILTIRDDGNGIGHCACLGGPTLELYGAGKLLATVALHHGHSIRWSRWNRDALLRHPEKLRDWLGQRDVPEEEASGGPDAAVMTLLTLRPAERLAHRADSYKDRGVLARAFELCEQALALEPGLPLALAVRSFLRDAAGDNGAAKADWEAAVAAGLRDPEMYWRHAIDLDGRGCPDQALADLDRVLDLAPQHVNAHNSRGLVLMRLGRHEEALAAYDRAIELEPEWALARANRANLLLEMDRNEDALTECGEALRLIGNGSPAEVARLAASGITPSAVHAVRALAHAALGRREEAVADYAKAIELGPDDFRAYYLRGGFLLHSGEAAGAIDDLTEALRLRPGLTEALLVRARAYRVIGTPEAALGDYDEVLRQAPEEVPALLERALTLTELGRTAEAVRDLDRSLELHPGISAAYWLRSRCWSREGKPDAQRDDLEQAVRLDPESVDAQNSLAWLLATCPEDRLRDGPRAVVLAERVVNRTGGADAHVLDTLAAAHAECGHFQQAQAYERRAMALAADPARLEDYENRLALYEAGRPYRSAADSTDE